MAVAYRPVYEEHLKMLDKFEEHTKEHGILPKILQRLHNNGQWAPFTVDYAFSLMVVPASSRRPTHWEINLPATFRLRLSMPLFVNSRTVMETWAILKMMTSCSLSHYLCLWCYTLIYVMYSIDCVEIYTIDWSGILNGTAGWQIALYGLQRDTDIYYALSLLWYRLLQDSRQQLWVATGHNRSAPDNYRSAHI